jgi:MFS-type transporter involved in bile tolerance (Atg22 family)
LVSSVLAIVSFTFGWCYMPLVKAGNILEEGKSLLWQGFAQNWQTWLQINRQYKRSLRWFLLGVLFAEPAANGLTTASVVYLNDQLKMSGTEIGIMLFVVLLAMVPGGLVFHCIAHHTDPNTSLCFSLLMLFGLCVVGALNLTPEIVFPWVFIWGAGLGLMLGCYYPSIKMFLSFVVPHGQEAEVTGFFVYCSQILVWLPPLIFSILVEMNVDQKFGVIAIGSFGLVSIVFFQMAAPFNEILDEIHGKPNTDLSKLTEPDATHGTMA